MLDKELEAGGNYYTFVEKIDIPDTEKQQYITEYEDTWIENNGINVGEYPGNGTPQEKYDFVQSIADAIEQYKKSHPNYKQEIKESCIKEQKERYEAYIKEQKKKSPKKSAPQNWGAIFQQEKRTPKCSWYIFKNGIDAGTASAENLEGFRSL